ncbi:polysaccharide lyase family 7 protein [Antarcticirhabdus aurantiaca]|uniref:Polysaccharide lyase family 7 protein n=1 Tax=Antarcticirhabdus aurantiaca TaxID=2606717 RepID=A0ACD4NPG1_9HYPH|nr:polysaccharide lyase family 7 protein [Antarcticirhabdus aurantiaca]WAJ28737.1 polysaccharide lyase family 7 protein [Jeongeuplla avenae]
MPVNSDNFDLSNWKLTLPVDAKNSLSGTAVEVKDLVGYENDGYFFDRADGAMVFRAMTDGATTSGSKYARSELREMNGSDRAAWSLSEGGTMTATLSVDAVPTRSDGSAGRVVVGQIHGQDDELVRLYWEKNSTHFVNDQAGSGNAETTFLLKNAAGQTPDISLGEVFSYKIDAQGNQLEVSVFADGDVYTSVSRINPVWQSDTFYFKAGVYLGVNDTQGSGVGQTVFHGLDFSHQDGKGLGGLVGQPSKGGGSPPPTEQPPTEQPPVVVEMPEPAGPSGEGESITGTKRDDSLSGTGKDDTLYGRSGDDSLAGGAGKDVLWGNGGDDRLEGGAGDDWMKGGSGRDVYVFSAGHGHDTVHEFRKGDAVIISNDLFSSVDEVRDALRQVGDGVVLETGDGSGILFTDTTVDTVGLAAWTFVEA